MAEIDIDAIFDLVQNEFDHLDSKIGSRSKRLMAITDFPPLARDLYLVHDIVAITCNSGTGEWIAYHHDEPGWIDCAVEAFEHIGHPQVAVGIQSCLTVFLSKRDSMTYKDDEVPSNYIMDHEHEIMRSLYSYLLSHGYVFRAA
jgi:hypothetical protein